MILGRRDVTRNPESLTCTCPHVTRRSLTLPCHALLMPETTQRVVARSKTTQSALNLAQTALGLTQTARCVWPLTQTAVPLAQIATVSTQTALILAKTAMAPGQIAMTLIRPEVTVRPKPSTV